MSDKSDELREILCKCQILDGLNSTGIRPDCAFYRKLRREVYDYMKNLKVDPETLKNCAE
jgi:hypothetical protein